MAQLTHIQYDALERAVVDGTRVVIRRRGHRDHIIVPLRLTSYEKQAIVAFLKALSGTVRDGL